VSAARIYVATGNAHKVRELTELARQTASAGEAAPAIELVLPERMPEVVEDSGTFRGNARKKALALRAGVPAGSWVLADDSGLVVAALGGRPGVESAYFAGPRATWRENLDLLLHEMAAVPDGRRQAFFFCLLFLIAPNGAEHVFEGRCDGHIVRTMTGGAGFGYDPVFVPEGFAETYAELGTEAKNRISHRARAWTVLAAWLAQQS
jgi:XTP/dITP diphosphohydrolase